MLILVILFLIAIAAFYVMFNDDIYDKSAIMLISTIGLLLIPIFTLPFVTLQPLDETKVKTPICSMSVEPVVHPKMIFSIISGQKVFYTIKDDDGFFIMKSIPLEYVRIKEDEQIQPYINKTVYYGVFPSWYFPKNSLYYPKFIVESSIIEMHLPEGSVYRNFSTNLK